jgi:hypothetical protein
MIYLKELLYDVTCFLKDEYVENENCLTALNEDVYLLGYKAVQFCES